MTYKTNLIELQNNGQLKFVFFYRVHIMDNPSLFRSCNMLQCHFSAKSAECDFNVFIYILVF